MYNSGCRLFLSGITGRETGAFDYFKPVYLLHRQLYPFPFEVYAQYFHRDADEWTTSVGSVMNRLASWEMDKPVLLDAYIDKSSEVGDVADNTG